MKKALHGPNFTDRERGLLQCWDERNVPVANAAFERRLLRTSMTAQDPALHASGADPDATEVLMAADAILDAPGDEADVRKIRLRTRGDELTHPAFKHDCWDAAGIAMARPEPSPDALAEDEPGEAAPGATSWHLRPRGALPVPARAYPHAVFARSGDGSRRARLAMVVAIGSLAVLATAGAALYRVREAQQDALADLHRVEQQLVVAEAAAALAARDLEARTADLEARNAELKAKNADLVAAIHEAMRARELAEQAQLLAEAAELRARRSERRTRRATVEALAAEAAAAEARRANEKIEVLLAQERQRVEELATLTRGAKIIPDLSVPAPGPRRASPEPGAQPVNPLDLENDDRMPWSTGVTPAARDAARQAFLEGNRLFHIPLFLRAAEKYTEALSKWKHPVFYFNLAITQIHLGQYLEAHRNLDGVLAFGGEPLGAGRAREARQQLGEVERHLGQLHIRCAVPGAEVTLDGELLFIGPGNKDSWVSARDHEVVARKAGHAARTEKVIVAAGAQQTVTLALHDGERRP
jgi:hypothetical protein